MKLIHSLLLLIAVMPVFAQSASPALDEQVAVVQGKNGITRHYTSSEQLLSGDRIINYPTQIVRIAGTINTLNTTCDEVFRAIDQLYLDYLSHSGMYYINSYSYCGYDPKTEMANQLIISSYFDPVSDKAVSELTEWLESMKGAEIYGLPFTVESAKELIVSLKISSGYKEGRDDPNLLVYRTDTTNLLFASNYQMKKELVDDIRQRFYSYEPKVILPFLEQWFFPGSAGVYQQVLASSNYVLLEPHRMFIMDNEPQLFTPMLNVDFAHQCFESKTKFCL
ncbi:Lpg0189 family type II secretion system effector [Legionella bononiensis]|uniref:Lpg0189 family type II secretion system effector n=1 Tax=Legionella bononiensis TaxID=2793102 RepID=A0ABS1WCT0_9GAMM|nr:Lpg0189 family type II secretion system effector [Legionella bononiensis]MBL7479025.1 Lpg0189 family type II secretion system effector [Legionella bononiensis]MBL7527158.1 Lpg0189 family type II secretion system effector [Legionella bononiensis]MBL7562127.1 Lpg0189 family type II secretion system effector [Legionella bononiensis]